MEFILHEWSGVFVIFFCNDILNPVIQLLKLNTEFPNYLL